MTSLPGLDDILTARARLAGRTRVVALERAGADVWWACEYRQPTGSFKIRGATNAVLAAAPRGVTAVTTASTGNHARAVTHVARAEGLDVTAFVSRGVAPTRVRALERAGARVDRRAADQAEAIALAEAAAAEGGHVFVPPFDDPEVIAGQGTLGLELGEALPDLDAVVVPVSGGGLAAGVGLALRGRYPGVRLVGVGAERAPAMARSLAAGHPVAVPEESTVATSLMGDLGAHNRFSFAVCREVLDEMVLVSDDDLIAATGALHTAGHPVEPAAAAGAALLPRLTGRRVAVVLTGRADAPDEGNGP